MRFCCRSWNGGVLRKDAANNGGVLGRGLTQERGGLTSGRLTILGS